MHHVQAHSSCAWCGIIANEIQGGHAASPLQCHHRMGFQNITAEKRNSNHFGQKGTLRGSLLRGASFSRIMKYIQPYHECHSVVSWNTFRIRLNVGCFNRLITKYLQMTIFLFQQVIDYSKRSLHFYLLQKSKRLPKTKTGADTQIRLTDSMENLSSDTLSWIFPLQYNRLFGLIHNWIMQFLPTHAKRHYWQD